MLPGFEEELAAIEAENRRLKRLLIVKLREENDRLKFALRRFGAPEHDAGPLASAGKQHGVEI